MSLNDFSWNRVRISLLNLERTDHYWLEDTLCVDFVRHGQSVWLRKNGSGVLYHPWSNPEGTPRYNFVMPKDVQRMVQLLWKTYKTPIPFNINKN